MYICANSFTTTPLIVFSFHNNLIRHLTGYYGEGGKVKSLYTPRFRWFLNDKENDYKSNVIIEQLLVSVF